MIERVARAALIAVAIVFYAIVLVPVGLLLRVTGRGIRMIRWRDAPPKRPATWTPKRPPRRPRRP